MPWSEEDDDGHPIPLNSVVMLPTDFVASDVGDKQLAALEILKSLYTQQRQNLTDASHSPDGTLVKKSDWSKAMIVTDTDSGNRSRTREALIARKLVVEVDGGYVKPA